MCFTTVRAWEIQVNLRILLFHRCTIACVRFGLYLYVSPHVAHISFHAVSHSHNDTHVLSQYYTHVVCVLSQTMMGSDVTPVAVPPAGAHFWPAARPALGKVRLEIEKDHDRPFQWLDVHYSKAFGRGRPVGGATQPPPPPMVAEQIFSETNLFVRFCQFRANNFHILESPCNQTYTNGVVHYFFVGKM